MSNNSESEHFEIEVDALVRYIVVIIVSKLPIEVMRRALSSIIQARMHQEPRQSRAEVAATPITPSLKKQR